MEFRFVSKKPWVDETLRLRKSLIFTTLTMVILGIVLAIIGIVLLAYMEFVVGVIAVTFGILLPVGYLLANVVLFARRRKAYDKSMIIEYKFTDDALEIVKLSNSYKSKTVISYSELHLVKVLNKPRYILLRTKSFYTDMFIIRKAEIDTDGDQGEAISSFLSFLMSNVVEKTAPTSEVTCADEEIESASGETVAEDSAEIPESSETETPSEDVTFEDLTEHDEVVDIEDEDNGLELDLSERRCDVESSGEIVSHEDDIDR